MNTMSSPFLIKESDYKESGIFGDSKNYNNYKAVNSEGSDSEEYEESDSEEYEESNSEEYEESDSENFHFEESKCKKPVESKCEKLLESKCKKSDSEKTKKSEESKFGETENTKNCGNWLRKLMRNLREKYSEKSVEYDSKKSVECSDTKNCGEKIQIPDKYEFISQEDIKKHLAELYDKRYLCDFCPICTELLNFYKTLLQITLTKNYKKILSLKFSLACFCNCYRKSDLRKYCCYHKENLVKTTNEHFNFLKKLGICE